MQFTQETDYAFRIVSVFTSSENDSRLTAGELSASEHIPYRFLLRVLGKLKKAGIVESRQGIDGGYRLARSPEKITLLDVVLAVEGEIRINRCLKDVAHCNAGRAPNCRVHQALGAAQERFLDDLNSYTFGNL